VDWEEPQPKVNPSGSHERIENNLDFGWCHIAKKFENGRR